MDGLKIKEYKYFDVIQATDYFRFEAEYFTAQNLEGENIFPAINFIERVQYGTSEFLNEEKQGYPILRLNEFERFFIKEPAKYCNLISQSQYDELKLHKGDVLVCRTNGNPDFVGRAAIVMEESECAFASYLFRVNINNNITPEYFVAFLQSKFGRREIDKNSMKSNQTNFSPAKLKDIKIPKLSLKFCLKITECFSTSYMTNKKAKASYLNAENILKKHLCIKDNSEKAISIKSKLKSINKFGRLDAEYYHPKYDDLFTLLNSQKTQKLGGDDGLVDIKKSIEPGSGAYIEDGIPFVRVSDIDKFGISDTTIKLSKDIVDNIEDLYPKKDTILLSKDGSVGIAYKLEDNIEVVTSSALLHLTVRDKGIILPDYLTLVLNSPIVQLQAERDCNGAIIQHWKPSDIEKVLIPILDMDVQQKIADEVQESFRLRRESKRLLDVAVKAVETAIEADEKTALEWLELQK